MKQIINIVLFALVIAGCNDNSGTAGKESKTTVNEGAVSGQSGELQSDIVQPGVNDVDVDTIGMAEFLALKAADAAKYRQSNRTQSNGINDASDANDASDVVMNDVTGIDVDTIGFAEFKRLKAESVRRAFADSIRRAEIIAERKKYAPARSSKTSSPERVRQRKESEEVTEPSDQTEVAAEPPVAEKEKKGWSKKAKGAVIGAATGAAAGAVINKKNRGVGGVVGGVIGAAAGYGVGRHKDKKGEKEEIKKDSTEEQQ